MNVAKKTAGGADWPESLFPKYTWGIAILEMLIIRFRKVAVTLSPDFFYTIPLERSRLNDVEIYREFEMYSFR